MNINNFISINSLLFEWFTLKISFIKGQFMIVFYFMRIEQEPQDNLFFFISHQFLQIFFLNDFNIFFEEINFSFVLTNNIIEVVLKNKIKNLLLKLCINDDWHRLDLLRVLIELHKFLFRILLVNEFLLMQRQIGQYLFYQQW